MDLSIVIISYNTCQILDECIESIKRETLCAYEIIVADNASTDESCLMLREKHPYVVLIKNTENVGFAKANNQGFANARGKYFLMLNPDTVILDGAIDKLVEFLDQHQDVGICGPRNVGRDGKLQHNCDHFPSIFNTLCEYTNFVNRFPAVPLFRRSRMLYWDYAEQRDVDKIMGCSLLVRAEIFNQLGGLDSKYFMYFEETDLCFNIYRLGKRVVYLPNAVIIHYGGESSLAQYKETVVSKTIYSYYLKSKYYYCRKNYSLLYMLAMRFLDFGYGSALLLRNAMRSDKKKMEHGRLKGQALLKNSLRFA